MHILEFIGEFKTLNVTQDETRVKIDKKTILELLGLVKQNVTHLKLQWQIYNFWQ